MVGAVVVGGVPGAGVGRRGLQGGGGRAAVLSGAGSPPSVPLSDADDGRESRPAPSAAGAALPSVRLESRMDAAFFDDRLLDALEPRDVVYTVSVPFARFSDLKATVGGDGPAGTSRSLNCAGSPPAGIPADAWWSSGGGHLPLGAAPARLLEPREHGFEFKAVSTNRRVFARAVALFHEGRGAQQAMFAELKSQCGLGYAPCRRRLPTAPSPSPCLPTDFGRELQMASSPPTRRTTAKRSSLWAFAQLPWTSHRQLADFRPTVSQASSGASRSSAGPFVRHLDGPEPRRRLAVIDLAQSHRHPLAIEQKTL